MVIIDTFSLFKPTKRKRAILRSERRGRVIGVRPGGEGKPFHRILLALPNHNKQIGLIEDGAGAANAKV
jgi:hypothetical protein